jgi:hypothetical protein
MNYPVLYQWTEEIANHLPGLNTWQAANIALFSQGVVQAESSRQETIARQVVCGERVASAARRLRRFLSNRALDLQVFFTEWTRWVIGALDDRVVYLLVDETKLNDRLGVMVVGVAYEGRCIPLAWRCYRANRASDYPPEGQVAMIDQLLAVVQTGMPAGRMVTVMADRGIGTSPALCRCVEARGWQYLFRVTCQSKVCTAEADFTIAHMVQPGEVWRMEGHIFKQRGQLPAQARALWTVGYDEPWALVTNADDLTGYEYAVRNWQEQSFRDLKSYGWQWESSAVHHPDHMARLMIVLVVAYAWVVALGSYAAHWGRVRPPQRHPDGQTRRHWSLFKEGLRFFIEYIQRHRVCLTLCFVPDKRFM